MVALVTGGGRGIGAGVAQALAAAGWDVALGYHAAAGQAQALALQLATQHGVRTLAVGCDVAEAVQVEAMFATVEQELGQVELLVNNAGIALQQLFTDTTVEQWDRLFDVDVRGVFLCSRAAVRGMLHTHRGSIINISSIWGITGASCEVAYSAAKAAVIGLTKALAKEVGPAGIRVNCIAPGVIDTQMNAALDAATLAQLREETPLGSIGTPQDIGALVVFLASQGGQFITGQVISPNGGMVI